MAASMIPPPIVHSTYLSSRKQPERSVIVETHSPAEDRQRELEADLQFLLDAQAEGLTRTVGEETHDGQSSTGSTTPTARSYRTSSARRPARPIRRKPGIKSARKGIYNSILALSALKEEELQSINDEAEENERTLDQINEWDDKRRGLQEASHDTDDSREAVRSQRLRQEADTLQVEINHVELQLADLKARQRKLLRQAAAVENSVQAQLASYTSSLSMLEAEIQRFLSLEPKSRTRSLSQVEETSLWELSPRRRTLDMAREHWKKEGEAIVEQRRDIEREKLALDQGAYMWKEVVVELAEFEKQMRVQMSSLSLSASTQAWEDPPQRDESEGTKELLSRVCTAMQSLQAKLKLAEERDWKLLIAAIGAELDALNQGKQLLQGLVEQPPEPQPDLVETDGPSWAGNGSVDRNVHLREVETSFEGKRVHDSPKSTSDTEDDPDPELLFSRQDTDVE